MDKKIKDKWVKALRSGEYRQGSAALRSVLSIGTEDTFNRDRKVKENTVVFCCLGVLCDIAGGAIHDGDEWPTDTFSKKVKLPHAMQKKLADMNDEGISFLKIANYIEKKMDEDIVEHVEHERIAAENKAKAKKLGIKYLGK